MYLIQGILRTELPFRVFLPDGSSRTCLNELTEAQLAELDIYPVDEIRPELLPTQHYGQPEISISDGRATANYPVIDYTETELAEMLNAEKEAKKDMIETAYDEHVAGSFVCSFGYPMQFNKGDSLLMEGAIQLLEASGGATGYITDAEDVSHYDVPIADMKAVKIEMLAKYAEAHAKKQVLRAQVDAATDIEAVNVITW